MIKELAKEFVNPGSQYRGAPFWAWNGELEPEELRRQIRDMHKMGLGGFFMHSRVGLSTDYLSPRWFECVKACIDEAEKLDMQAWLYDEDRWPSGAAGGLVTSNPEFQAREVVCQEISDISELDKELDTVALYFAEIDGRKAAKLERLEGFPVSVPAGKTLIHFYIKAQDTSSWYNGQTYLDTLNEDAVKKFIEVTHEKYKQEIGDEFGKRVPGIFTDEPNYGLVCPEVDGNKYTSPWTNKLPEIFKERYGYDLLDNLPELFYELEGVEISRVKYNYIDCITFLFVNAFSKQIGEWCEQNNMLSTGHLLGEDRPGYQTYVVGSCMQSYEYMQAPGIDMLTEHWRCYDTAKQLSSAARQFDRKWRLSETYGCTGWDFPFAGHKAVGDWQAALGVNLRCQHLAWYTMEGEAKRDYPASIFYQSPWHLEYKKVEDYFARVNLAMTQGREIRDVLVIHPVESSWTMIGKNWKEAEKTTEFDRKFICLRDCLLGDNIDFDYGDEELLARHGRIEDKLLKVKFAEYKTVIVPEMITMRASTLKLLKEFKNGGGRVIFSAPAAQYVDAGKSDAAELFQAQCETAPIGPELTALVSAEAGRVSIKDAENHEIFNTLYQHREDAENAYLFVCNTGHETRPPFEMNDKTLSIERTRAIPEMTISIQTAKKGVVIEVDLESGECSRVDAEKTPDGWKINSSLAALGSRLFIISSDPAATEFPGSKKLQETGRQTIDIAEYPITLAEPNVLPLLTAELKIADGEWSELKHIIDLDDSVRCHLGIQCRGGQMEQPWVRKDRISKKSVPVTLKYSFDCEKIPAAPLYLGIERPETFKITLNGKEIATDKTCGWWCDRSLKKLEVDPAFLQTGNNELILECLYSEAYPGLEYIYLLGNFGVKYENLKLTMTAPVTSLKTGDWVEQGLPFYSGAVTYKCNIDCAPEADEHVFIRLPEYRGACVKLTVNGKEAGIIAWPPNELDVTAYLEKGSNELLIEVISSRRNSHGPFFQAEKWPLWTGPAEYHEYTGVINLVPCGLLKKPEIIIKK
jgi:hypothetical protein